MSEFVGGYNEKIIDHFKNPRNVGEIEDADVKSTEGSPACGDRGHRLPVHGLYLFRRELSPARTA